MLNHNRISKIGATEVIHRRIPIMVSIIVVLLLMMLVFVLGLMIGYGILHSPFDIFRPSTWTHLLKLTGSDS